MKAIRVHEFGGPEVLKLEQVPDLVAGPGQVVVDVKAIGVNPVESYIRTGTYASKPNLPYTPGNDAAGVAREVGAGVTSVKVGERVYTSQCISGAYAEQALCNALNVHPLPDKLALSKVRESALLMGRPFERFFNAEMAKRARGARPWR